MEFIKKHPYVLVGAVGGIILLLYMSNSGGGANSAVAAEEGANVSLANLSASLQSNQIDANAALAGDALQYLTTANNNATAEALKTTEVNGAIAINNETTAANATVAPALAEIAAANNLALAKVGTNAATVQTNSLLQALTLRSLLGSSGLGGVVSGIGSTSTGLINALLGSGTGAGAGSVASGGATYLQTLNAENAAKYGSLAGYAY